jgi:hypothetical protein
VGTNQVDFLNRQSFFANASLEHVDPHGLAECIIQRSELVLDPAGSLVRILTGHDVELAVAIDVGEGAGLISAGIDLMLAKRDFVGTSDGPGDRGQER